MLCITLQFMDRCPIRQHPLIIKFLKGCYNLNPPKPKYNVTWDPNRVLNYMVSLGDNNALPISVLVGKLATLLALATPLRVSELVSIPFLPVKLSENWVQFALSKLRKAQRNGPVQSFTLPACPDLDTCPVTTLRSYVDCTGTNRPSNNEGMLFISMIAPFGSVKGSTGDRRIKNFLREAGINTAVFSAHSNRSFASSLTVGRGLSIDVVLRLAIGPAKRSLAAFTIV